MSHEDSLDDETTATILSIANSDDSKESDKSKKKNLKANDTYNIYETNTLESPDSEW